MRAGLPQEKIDEAIKKFNTNRANSLKEINQSGKKLAIETRKLTTKTQNLQSGLMYINKSKKINFEIKQLEAQVEVLKNQPIHLSLCRQ